MKTTILPEEVEKFSKIAHDWWNIDGKFKPLHQFNPLRLNFIRDTIEEKFGMLSSLKVLDIGCGGGLISEPMARLGLSVTGADASENNIKTAMQHASEQNLSIEYLVTTAEELSTERSEYYDVILNLEVIEHVADPKFFIQSCIKMLKPDGIMIVATLNRTPLSYAFAILGAEYILRWLPIGTHDWNKFLKPQEIDAFCSPELTRSNIIGASFNPLSQRWSKTDNTQVNYIAVYERSFT
jgi:2-polyprenyl-6-hydroxyphenyl methylase/3-demethylubiquinone-9 3-methyltransferase